MLEAADRSALSALKGPPLLPLEACHLSFEDRGRVLLRDLSLRLDRGTKTVIMGPNGAGKSLLLRLLHGLLTPTAGEVLWAGAPANDAVRERQAMVFQRPTLLRRSAEANLRFALRHLSATVRAERAAALLASAGLEAQAHTPARLLSGGQQQRLAIARALALEPEILFLDEPAASLDPASTQAVEDMIEAAHREGTKIVLFTHDVGQARRLADEIVFLHAGRLAEVTPASSFFRSPRSRAAEAYLDGRICL